MKKTISLLKRGFTLIELLVVIAIIGILAAVVLASLNDARDGGKDASAKGSMTSIRNQAELFYNKNSYAYQTGTTNMCGTDTDITALITAVENQVPGTVTCVDEPTYYHAYVTLNNSDIFCIDSTGYAGKVDSGSETQTVSGEVICDPS